MYIVYTKGRFVAQLLAAGCPPHRHGFNTRHSVWNLWWKSEIWAWYFPKYLRFSCPYCSTKFSQ